MRHLPALVMLLVACSRALPQQPSESPQPSAQQAQSIQPAQPLPQSYDTCIAQATQAKKQNNAALVLELSRAAMKIDARRFEAPFLAGAAAIDYGLADLALRYEQRALFLAPNDKRPALERLVAQFMGRNLHSRTSQISMRLAVPLVSRV